MLAAFPVALKHRVKFEPYIDYDDMRGYIDYLDTYAREANVGVSTLPKPVPKLKRLGQILDLPVAIDNPRSQIKNATRPLGNLPQEMLIYLQSYMDGIIDAKQMPAPIFQVQSSE
jgi:ion channel-forming bestrophin family protein